jgi:hypothetical protein
MYDFNSYKSNFFARVLFSHAVALHDTNIAAAIVTARCRGVADLFLSCVL